MFPKSFIWGVASSAYQIEGAYNKNKIPSIWDTFSNIENNIDNNENGNIAANSYNLYPEDIKIMKDMKIQAYRFSISWTRIFKEDMITVNKKGLEYYTNLVDMLIENNITPYITLFHWDLPQILEDNGGWFNKETITAFQRYAEVIAKTFNNKVFDYVTINEPQIIVNSGYSLGIHAPGKKLSDQDCLKISHNILLAHGYAVRAIRNNSDNKVNVGIASTGNLVSPIEDTEENIYSAYKESFKISENNLFFTHSLFLDPIFLKKYPDSLSDNLKEVVNTFDKNDFDIISEPLDFLGVNIYNGQQVDGQGNYVTRYQGFPKTALRWPVTPNVMYYGIIYLYKRYNTPIIITENGQSCNDRIYSDGKVHDFERIDFMNKYLSNLKITIENQIPVIGYFHWSFSDNFEWHNGYNERFGLVYIDYRTQKRILKDSAYYYSKVISKNDIINLEDFISVNYK
jgi:beta-glucosidase